MKKILSGLALAFAALTAQAQTFTVQNLQVNGVITGATGGIALTSLATQASNTVLANAAGSAASPTAVSIPSCSTSASALNWTFSTGFTCNTAVVASNVSGVVAVANGGTGASTATGGVGNLQYLNSSTGGVARTLQSKFKDFVNPLDFGADCTGATDSTSALNNALAGGGTVYLNGGCTYLINSTVNIPGFTNLVGDGKTILKRGASNTADLLSFNGSYSFASNLIVNGNSSATGFSHANVEVRLGNTTSNNYNVLSHSVIQNSAGYGAVVNSGFGNIITDNTFLNIYDYAVFVSAPNAQSNSYVARNLIQNIGWGAVEVQNDLGFTVEANQALGNNVGEAGSPLVVNTSGTTVTWVSGPTFTSVLPGNWLVINGGQEYRVVTVNSSTSLTVASSPGTLSSAPASVGTGDLFGFINVAYGRIFGNLASDSATFGIALSIGGGSNFSIFNDVSGNRLIRNGKNAINLTYDSGTGSFTGTSIHSNIIVDPGFSRGIGTTDAMGIYLAGGTAGKVADTFIYDNTLSSTYGSSGQATYWLGTDTNFNNGAVLLGKNGVAGFVNSGVFGDVKSSSLSGWGSTATLSSIVSNGDSLLVTITLGGTGQTPNPNFSVVKVCDVMNTPTVPMVMVGGITGSTPLAQVFGTTNSSRGTWSAVYNTTPATSGTITFALKG